MAENDNVQWVYRPKTLYESLSLFNTFKTALVFAGGTELMQKKERGQIQLKNRRIIYLGDVEELGRISRTERYIEIGAAAPVSKILTIGKNVISKLFYDALQATATPSVKNMATIGGNICAASSYSTILPALFALDTRIEVRSLAKAVWMPVNRFVLSSGKTILEPGEIVTRLRIPFREWLLQKYRKISTRRTQRISNLVFCAVAKTLKDVITDIRLVYGAIGPRIFRSREYEAGFIGRKLPLSEKEIGGLLSELETILSKLTGDSASAVYKKETSLRLTRWFINELNGMGL